MVFDILLYCSSTRFVIGFLWFVVFLFCFVFPLFSFPLMIWSFQQISGGSLHTNAPKFLGLGSCGTASRKWCDGFAVVAPLWWLIYSRSWVKHGGNCQETQAGKVQNLTQISSEMSGRVITLLWSYMRWLVNQPVSWCMHTHTHTQVFPCGLLIHRVLKTVNSTLQYKGQKVDH